MLCKMVDKYGGTVDPNFPPKEKHDAPEFYVEALGKESSSSGITLSFKVTNHSAWPARVQDNISFRYYMDLSEVIAAGKNPEDIVIRCDRDQSQMYSGSGVKPAEISKPKKYDGNIYYIEVNLPDGRAVLPISEGRQQCEILLAIVMPDYGSGWDATNDFSNKDILGGKTAASEDGTAKGIITPYVPVYVNGKLYYGYEPDGTYADGLGGTAETDQPKVTTTTTKPKTTTTTSKATTTTTTTSSSGESDKNGTVIGDANLDDRVTVADAVAILQFLGNKDKYKLDAVGKANADVYNRGDGITGMDAVTIQYVDSGKYKQTDLPIMPD